MTTTAAQTSALKFRDMILSKFANTTPTAEPSEEGSVDGEANNLASSEAPAAAKSRLSFSVDSLLKKKVSKLDEDVENEDEMASIEDEDDIDEEEPEDLSSNNNDVKPDQDSPKLAIPTPLMPNSMAALAASMRPQPHFLAAGIAAMAAAAAAANNSQAVTSTTATTSINNLPFSTNGGSWPPTAPPGHPGHPAAPPLGFPFGIPGLRHPLFSSTGNMLACLRRREIFLPLTNVEAVFRSWYMVMMMHRFRRFTCKEMQFFN